MTKIGSKWTGNENMSEGPSFCTLLVIGVVVLVILAATGLLGEWAKLLCGPCGIFAIAFGGMVIGTAVIE